MRERGGGALPGSARVAGGAAARERAAAGGRSGCKRWLEAGGWERRAGAAWLSLSTDTVSPAGLRERAGKRAHPPASIQARAREPHCCSPGRPDLAAAVFPRVERESRALLRRQPGARRPPWVSSPADCSPGSGKLVSFHMTGSELVPADPRERVGGWDVPYPRDLELHYRGAALLASSSGINYYSGYLFYQPRVATPSPNP